MHQEIQAKPSSSFSCCVLRQSCIQNWGRGVILCEVASHSQLLFKYGGNQISFLEADLLVEQVCTAILICVWWTREDSGYARQAEYHVLLCTDSRISSVRSMEGCLQTRIVRRYGFVNTKERKFQVSDNQ